MIVIKCLVVALFVTLTHAATISFEDDSEDAVYLGPPLILAQMREKRSAFPGRAMMFHGYFGSPGHPYHTSPQAYDRHNGRTYDPQHEVPTEVANGKPEHGEESKPENGAAYPNGNGNGADNEVPQENGNGGDEGYLGDQPAAEETPKGETLQPAAPTQPTAPEGPKKVPDESDEEEDEPSFFSHKPRGRGTYYNSYFPMMFGAFPGYGGGQGGNRGEDGAYNPGVATAIANSFSTGRGAVATSHATAYGGPQFVPSGFRKNGSKSRPH